MAGVLDKAKDLVGKYGDKALRWATPYELRPHEHVTVTPDKMTTEFHQIKRTPKPRAKDVSAQVRASKKKDSYGY